MVDPAEQKLWYESYLAGAVQFVRPTRKVKAWALSMAKIADQHCDGDDADLVDA